jgi:hypothetical protein
MASLLSGCSSDEKGKPKLIGQRGTADTVILLWMAGGMAHTETFDPKRYTPLRRVWKVIGCSVRSNPVPTALDGIHFSEGLQSIGKVMDRGTLIRSYVAADMGHILHSRHQYHWHTCYEPPQTVAAPHHRLLDCEGIRTQKSSHSRLYRYWSAVYGRGSRRTESFPYGGFSG